MPELWQCDQDRLSSVIACSGQQRLAAISERASQAEIAAATATRELQVAVASTRQQAVASADAAVAAARQQAAAAVQQAQGREAVLVQDLRTVRLCELQYTGRPAHASDVQHFDTSAALHCQSMLESLP